jgi:LysR family pca operon transcriptional activator
LSVTETAVSKTVKEPEDELGLQLFERSKRGMKLTEAGSRFTGYASNALSTLESGMRSARENAGVGTSMVRLGAMPVIAAVLLPEVMVRLQGPADIVVEVVSGSKATLLSQLHKSSLDLVLGRLPPPSDMSGLSFEQLFLDQYVFVVRPGHPLAGEQHLDLKDINGFSLVMPLRETVTWDEIQRLFVSQGTPLSATRVETIYLQLSHNYTLRSDAVWGYFIEACGSRHRPR